MSDYPDDSYTPKDKCTIKTSTKILCSESHNDESQSGNKKSKSTNEEEERMSEVISWTSVNQNFIKLKSLLVYVLSNIAGDLYRKSN